MMPGLISVGAPELTASQSGGGTSSGVEDVTGNPAFYDFNNPVYEGLNGSYSLVVAGAVIQNSPRVLSPSTIYSVVIRGFAGPTGQIQFISIQNSENLSLYISRSTNGTELITDQSWSIIRTPSAQFDTVSTTDNTYTPVITVTPVLGQPVTGTIRARAVRDDGALYVAEFRVGFIADDAGNYVYDTLTPIMKAGVGLNLRLTETVSGVDIEVRGKSGQDWDWLVIFESEVIAL